MAGFKKIVIIHKKQSRIGGVRSRVFKKKAPAEISPEQSVCNADAAFILEPFVDECLQRFALGGGQERRVGCIVQQSARFIGGQAGFAR